MSDQFFERPILNSPYEYPARHWELGDTGQPTRRVIDTRRPAKFITPVPKAKKQRAAQASMVLDEGKGLSTQEQQYDLTGNIMAIREQVDRWRRIPNPADWRVTAVTQRLLQHWRRPKDAWQAQRPFFCQVEAVETLIWLTEVAPSDARGRQFLDHLARANDEANPGLARTALKLATGAGKTTVMAMIIAWQTLNAVRSSSKRFTNGFLVVTPGITIKDRLRVLLPNEPDAYYQSRDLVPPDLVGELNKARIVITNYHAFKRRDEFEGASGTRALLQGRIGPELSTIESEGKMLQRVMQPLLGIKGIMVLNDEAHHCYREKPEADDDALKGDERKEAEENNRAARLWINGLEAVNRKLGLTGIVDLSATPFFLRGSGYAEGVLFPWVVNDFSLMDAIECGIVKLPRVPIDDNLNISGAEMPMYRNLWEHISKGKKWSMPKQNRRNAGALDPQDLSPPLLTALDALYGHYAKTFDLWQQHGESVPPCFIIVCNNTSTSKLVFDYITGYQPENGQFQAGRLRHFQNFDPETGNAYSRPRTLLIDSAQLESGEGFDPTFRKVAEREIEQFKADLVRRSGDQAAADRVSDSDLLREVMNTVGKEGRLGEQIRCVVSVSMLTEGWDANTVTHVLGVRAFGTQLLCEQVIGRALRRLSYQLNDDGLFDVEYADVLGIPFDFTAKPTVAPPQKPRQTVQVRALPERSALEIRFPRVEGYRVEMSADHFTAEFGPESKLRLTPDLIGATETRNSGIIGKQVDLTLEAVSDVRPSSVALELASYFVMHKWRNADGTAGMPNILDIRRICRNWINECLVCEGQTYPAQLKYKLIAEMASQKIMDAITTTNLGTNRVLAVLDPYNPSGMTRFVNFTTSKHDRWTTDPGKSHINLVVYDSEWEAEFCRVAEHHPRVRSYVKNQGLGFEVPYTFGGVPHRYIPDFILRIDDGHGEDDLLNLIVEIKGYRGEQAIEKKSTMDSRWIPGINALGTYGRWAFVEFTNVFTMQSEFAAHVQAAFNRIIEGAANAD